VNESPVSSPFSIVCVSSQAWHVSLPTNRQQIMRRAAARGHRVLFVETGGWIGRHLWALLRGGAVPGRASLLRRLTVGEEVAPGVQVRALIALAPFSQRSPRANRVNWRIGAAGLRAAARRLPAPRVLWIYDPRGADAVGTFGDAFAVYDCVDDYAEQAGPDGRTKAVVAAADRATAERARLVFATTRPLLERHAAVNERTHLVPNVGDFDHFARAVERATADPELLALPRPVLGFAGNLEATKVDFDLLEELARAFPNATVLVIGPAHDSSLARVERLGALPNVTWLGLRSYDDLPRAIAAFDVALIPYVENDYTRSCFPLKLYEYLAAGKPVVAAGLPELEGLEPHVVVAHDPGEAVQAVRRALETGADGVEGRVALAARNTWETRTSRLLELVGDELGS